MASYRVLKDVELEPVADELSAREAFIQDYLQKNVFSNQEYKKFFLSERNGGSFTNQPFDFYGGYVRINENQKYKYAETKTVLQYQALVKALKEKDE